MTKRKFCLYLIKPSHYDDQGYVIQWRLSPIPSNSLASVHGLTINIIESKMLGDDWDFDVVTIDETNTIIDVQGVIDRVQQADVGLVMLIGVQSNQFPRSLDLARPLLKAGVQVAIGGFHVSGVISMLNGEDADFKTAQQMGISLFAGESEGRLQEVFGDAINGTLKPLYNFMNDLPGIEDTPVPFMPADHVARTAYNLTSFDAGRGCPYQCSFCTIINVQGRKSRRRSPDDIEKIIRLNMSQGVHRYFITDDNFARNKDWEAIMDRLIHMREVEGLKFNFIIQVDTLCHRIPNFIEKCARAGVTRVFIGLENVNPANLKDAKKRQNKITEYRTMLLAWKQWHVITYAGYILGFPTDTPERIMHDIDVVKRELPVDILEFFFLTPLPGSEDHQKLHRAGVAMDPDLNKYDLNHVTTAHQLMSKAEFEKVYADAWSRYYTLDHVETLMRRAAVSKISTSQVLLLSTWFMGALKIEGVHPLEVGWIRIKSRLNRRYGMKIEPAVLFYPKYYAELGWKLARWGWLYFRFGLKQLKVERDPNRHAYTDHAMTPVTDHDEQDFELFKTTDAQAWLNQEKRIDKARHGISEPADTV
ncbi:B12-binding domain-containing radical SAM protein [Devosia sp. SL43]|uniref:B12-binding domain-containing radical SAM protein n=1 Tax=Devosia sp. SL43 TaxID=2806348 RepID=UPI001F2973A9|nr:radical SAM protein [Devosia sp. SL43]UJW86691.1 radical SAM protein [Devosia sp. SL43]